MAKKIYLLIFFMQNRQKIVIFLIVIAIVGIGSYFVFGNKVARKPIELNNRNQSLTISTEPLNIGEVSPISGLPCENWNRRPLAVMQPGDVTAPPVLWRFMCEIRRGKWDGCVAPATISFLWPKAWTLSLSHGGDQSRIQD